MQHLLAFERNYLAWIKLCISCMVISGALLLRLHVNTGATTSQRESGLTTTAQINESHRAQRVTSLEDQFAKPVRLAVC